jgi:hypothetical protein
LAGAKPKRSRAGIVFVSLLTLAIVGGGILIALNSPKSTSAPIQTPNPALGGIDARGTAAVRDNIRALMDAEPWYASIQAVEMVGSVVTVHVSPSILQSDADAICSDVAFFSHDGTTGNPIGYHEVQVVTYQGVVSACEVP